LSAIRVNSTVNEIFPDMVGGWRQRVAIYTHSFLKTVASKRQAWELSVVIVLPSVPPIRFYVADFCPLLVSAAG